MTESQPELCQSSEVQPPEATSPKHIGQRWLRLMFGLQPRVTRSEYLTVGICLMVLKYAGEALVIWAALGVFYSPLDFMNPVLSKRATLIQEAPPELGLYLSMLWFYWSLPFIWIAMAMSVRRAADAGISPWVAIMLVMPGLNLVLVSLLAILPSSAKDVYTAEPQSMLDGRIRAFLIAIPLSLVPGLLTLWISAYVFGIYGIALFFAAPVLMGAVSAMIFFRRHPGGYGQSVLMGMLSIVFAGGVLLILALEGVICIAMAAPIVLPLGALGGFLGHVLADCKTSYRDASLMLLVLPVWSGVEASIYPQRELLVSSSVEIDAPPEVVWESVLNFPEITEQPEWYFRLGIAYPIRGEITGTGVGAIRHCEFTTGTFVEPITVWDAPRRLAFDVTEQPHPMFELTPYRHVHPPHLDGMLRSNRGEFLLTPLPGGGTRLTGNTWYEFEIYPQSYWTLWSDFLIHKIHYRVLDQVKLHAETASNTTLK